MNIDFAKIPEEITVHMGCPDIEALNKNVFFVDYIKNISSREICPLWPENAIVAIMYAVSMCALYKLRSNWYRSIGYDFDITSDPESDMYYDPEREIYLNISLLADELFNTCASVTGDFINLVISSNDEFEEYKKYALKASLDGMDPKEILTSYYGSNIRISENDAGSDDIYESSVFPLKPGDNCEIVKTVQDNLNFLSHDFPVIPRVIPSGSLYTLSVETAVRSFQKNFYLKETGTVDQATWFKIRKYYFDALRLSDYIYDARKILDDSENITEHELWSCLNVIAYFNPMLNIVTCRDYSYDLLLYNINQFKKYYMKDKPDLDNTIVIHRIKKIFSVISDNIPERYFKDIAKPFSGRMLEPGTKGNDVACLQSYLRVISLNIPKISFSEVSGEYDKDTLRAVKEYQKIYGLAPNGVVGPITWNGIAKLYNYFSAAT
ncbi:MAG: peptidoglycan-binding domain-containing protein [Oscillospiraceae bacterium]|nr:peptidoglycan-binding domain-containing protein [Oscillospiraceae bacterium]